MNAQKMGPLKNWATQIATDMIQRIFQEFEREAGIAFDEVTQMRAELVRVSELLEGQMQREKELHALLESLHGHMAGAGAHAMGSMQDKGGPDLRQLHMLLDQAVQANSQQDTTQADVFARLEHALAQADGHSNHAKNLKQQSVTTEHELTRIKKLLAMPNPSSLPGRTPAAPSPMKYSQSTTSLPQQNYGYAQQAQSAQTYAGGTSYAPPTQTRPQTYSGGAAATPYGTSGGLRSVAPQTMQMQQPGTAVYRP